MTGHTENIEQLLRRCRLGDEASQAAGYREAIRAIMDVYGAPIYRLSLAILCDEEEAQDAVQETFIRAYDHLASYQPGTNLKAWLYHIAVNLCRGYLRKRRTRETLNRILAALHISEGSAAGPEGAMLRDERKVWLWAAVDQLGEKYRLVVILRIAHELPVREIAQILDIPEKTVYSRLYDAFRKLRVALKDAGVEEF